jgi:hypothetical protein
MTDRDVIRAAGASPYIFTTITAGDEPLIVDAVLPSVPNKHYIVESACCMLDLSTRAPVDNRGFPPLTGLFRCPSGTPIETLAQAQAGWNRLARPELLPMGAPGGDFASINLLAPFPFALVLAPGFKITLQPNYFIRAIVTCVQGTAAPGPGALSVGQLVVWATLENNDPCKV